MGSIATTSEAFGGGDYRWLASARGTESPKSATLDYSAFTEATHFPDGYFPSGLAVSKIAASGLYGPFGGGVPGTLNEIQTVTVGGSGLTSFTLTYSGQTTASIDDAATANDVEAALVALSNIAAGDVEVSGPAGGPWRVQFTGTLAGTNVAAMTATPTGGSGTVTIATLVGGVSGLDGFVYHDVAVSGTNDVTAAVLTDATVIAAYLPVSTGLTDGRYLCDTVAAEA